MKANGKYILAVGLVWAVQLLRAQTAAVGGGNGEVTSAQAEPPDSIVQLTADSHGLQTWQPAATMRGGTYWTILPDSAIALPYPCMPPGFNNWPAYELGNDIFLLDATGGNPGASPALLTAQAKTVVQLIDQTQNVAVHPLAGRSMRAMDKATVSADSEDSRLALDSRGVDGIELANDDEYVTFTPNTNAVWIEIRSVLGGTASLDLHVPTNTLACVASNSISCSSSNVFAVWVTTNLLDGWQVVADVWLPDPLPGTNPVVVPFTLPTLGQPALFVRAEDWNGVTTGGNLVPSWWFWQYYGTTDLADSNLDSQGRSLLSDYTNDLAPAIPLLITRQPANQIADLGTNAVFSVLAAGIPAPSYQWYFNGTNALATATNSAFTVINVQSNNAGSYSVDVFSSAGSVTSSNALLTVVNPLYDSTGDGLPDAWAQEYFGTIYVNPSASPTGNGWTILQDYQNGANPTSSAQPFLLNVTQPVINTTIP